MRKLTTSFFGLALLITLCAFDGCESSTDPSGDKILARWTASCTGLTCTFSNDTAGPAAIWEWQFDDGGRSFNRAPVHTYTVPGRYNVKLRACPGNDLQDARCDTAEGFINVTSTESTSSASTAGSLDSPLWEPWR